MLVVFLPKYPAGQKEIYLFKKNSTNKTFVHIKNMFREYVDNKYPSPPPHRWSCHQKVVSFVYIYFQIAFHYPVEKMEIFYHKKQTKQTKQQHK